VVDTVDRSLYKLVVFNCSLNHSPVATKFAISKTKVTYAITHELAPYFTEDLDYDIKICTAHVAYFDEALNNISQHDPMDIMIHHWNEDANQVVFQFCLP